MIGFDKTESPVTPSQIDGVELVLGIRFPSRYRELIQEFNGAYGDVNFPLPDSEFGESMGVWLSLLPWDMESIWSSLSAWKEHEIHSRVIPFGEDGGGNWICFDYRGKEMPSIVFYFHEVGGDEGLYPVADDFDSFVESFTLPVEDA